MDDGVWLVFMYNLGEARRILQHVALNCTSVLDGGGANHTEPLCEKFASDVAAEVARSTCDKDLIHFKKLMKSKPNRATILRSMSLIDFEEDVMSGKK